MRVALFVVAVVVLAAGCGGHGRVAAPGCALAFAPTPVPETGEHSLAVRSSCALPSFPRVSLDRLPFAFVPEGGPKGAHIVLFDKYRCDVHYRAIAREVRVGGAELRMKSSLMDWCPAEAVSTIVHVYLGGKHPLATWRGVLEDAYDGRLDRVWPCGALRAANAHLPVDGPTYSTLPGLIQRNAAKACGAALAGLPAGSPRAAFVEALGAPDLPGPRCPVWRWPPASGSVDGARVCFARDRATLVQTALHG